MSRGVDEQDYNIPPDDIKISWAGFESTIGKLKISGWKLWLNWNIHTKRYHFYIRHPLTKHCAHIRLTTQELFKYKNGENILLTLEPIDLLHERNRRVKPPKVMIEGNLTENDIGWMLEAIRELQDKREVKKPIKSLPSILEMLAA